MSGPITARFMRQTISLSARFKLVLIGNHNPFSERRRRLAPRFHIPSRIVRSSRRNAEGALRADYGQILPWRLTGA